MRVVAVSRSCVAALLFYASVSMAGVDDAEACLDRLSRLRAQPATAIVASLTGSLVGYLSHPDDRVRASVLALLESKRDDIARLPRPRRPSPDALEQTLLDLLVQNSTYPYGREFGLALVAEQMPEDRSLVARGPRVVRLLAASPPESALRRHGISVLTEFARASSFGKAASDALRSGDPAVEDLILEFVANAASRYMFAFRDPEFRAAFAEVTVRRLWSSSGTGSFGERSRLIHAAQAVYPRATETAERHRLSQAFSAQAMLESEPQLRWQWLLSLTRDLPQSSRVATAVGKLIEGLLVYRQNNAGSFPPGIRGWESVVPLVTRLETSTPYLDAMLEKLASVEKDSADGRFAREHRDRLRRRLEDLESRPLREGNLVSLTALLADSADDSISARREAARGLLYLHGRDVAAQDRLIDMLSQGERRAAEVRHEGRTPIKYALAMSEESDLVQFLIEEILRQPNASPELREAARDALFEGRGSPSRMVETCSGLIAQM